MTEKKFNQFGFEHVLIGSGVCFTLNKIKNYRWKTKTDMRSKMSNNNTNND